MGTITRRPASSSSPSASYSSRRTPPASVSLQSSSGSSLPLSPTSLGLTATQNDPRALLALMVRLFQHHQAMGLRDNGLASPWYTWPILWHPIIVKFAAHGLGSTYTSTLSNLALWAVADLALLGAPI